MSNSQEFIREFQKWLPTQPHVLAACFVGSHARGDARPDSDLDIVLITDTSDEYLKNEKWLSFFGVPERTEHEDYGLIQSIRAFYKNGPEVEYGITTKEWITHKDTQPIVQNGFKEIYDPHHLFDSILS